MSEIWDKIDQLDELNSTMRKMSDASEVVDQSLKNITHLGLVESLLHDDDGSYFKSLSPDYRAELEKKIDTLIAQTMVLLTKLKNADDNPLPTAKQIIDAVIEANEPSQDRSVLVGQVVRQGRLLEWADWLLSAPSAGSSGHDITQANRETLDRVLSDENSTSISAMQQDLKSLTDRYEQTTAYLDAARPDLVEARQQLSVLLELDRELESHRGHVEVDKVLQGNEELMRRVHECYQDGSGVDPALRLAARLMGQIQRCRTLLSDISSHERIKELLEKNGMPVAPVRRVGRKVEIRTGDLVVSAHTVQELSTALEAEVLKRDMRSINSEIRKIGKALKGEAFKSVRHDLPKRRRRRQMRSRTYRSRSYTMNQQRAWFMVSMVLAGGGLTALIIAPPLGIFLLLMAVLTGGTAAGHLLILLKEDKSQLPASAPTSAGAISAAPTSEVKSDLPEGLQSRIDELRTLLEDLADAPGSLLAEQVRLCTQRLQETVDAYTRMKIRNESSRQLALEEMSVQLDLLRGEANRLSAQADEEALRLQREHGSYLRDVLGHSELNLEKDS